MSTRTRIKICGITRVQDGLAAAFEPTIDVGSQVHDPSVMPIARGHLPPDRRAHVSIGELSLLVPRERPLDGSVPRLGHR